MNNAIAQTISSTDARIGVIDSDTWGIIYCPIEGGKRKWPKIHQYLDEKGIKYDFLQSDGPGSVERLASMYTKNGYHTIIVVGGDSALNYAINGILKTESPSGEIPTIGVIPNGLVNDFANYWDFERNNYKAAIDRLVLNKKRKIDVGIATGTLIENEGNENSETSEKDATAVHYFLNCVNIGAVASIVNIRRETKRFFVLSVISYVISAIILLFQRMSFNLEFTTAGEHFSRHAMTLCVGSAHGYGQTPSAVPYNGQLDVSLVTIPPITQLFHGLWLLFSGRFLSHKGISVWRTKQIEFQDLNNAPISLDGRMMPRNISKLKIQIAQEAIDFLI